MTDIRLGHHADCDVQPWYPRDEYAGYVIAPAGREPIATFLVYHGNAESAENKQSLAEVFVRFGYRVVLVEYPGYGKRQGARTMKAALAASRTALFNAKAQWAGTIFLLGEALGAGMAAQAIRGEASAVAGLLLVLAWDSLESVASEKLLGRFGARTIISGPACALLSASWEKVTVVLGLRHCRRATSRGANDGGGKPHVMTGVQPSVLNRMPYRLSNDTKSSEKCIKVVHFSVFATPRQRIYLKINALEKIDVKSSCLVERWAAEFREVG